MSATNSTTHYELPSFLGSDKPAWLVDWNGAMATIDSAIYEAKQAADAAGTSATAVASDLATLSGAVSTQGSTISTLSNTLTTAVGNINTINGNITTINSLIGNGTPTTTDQTIIGAINEINGELDQKDVLTVNPDGVTTWAQALALLDTAWQALADSEKPRACIFMGGGTLFHISNYSSTDVSFSSTSISATTIYNLGIYLHTHIRSTATTNANGTTFNDLSNTTLDKKLVLFIPGSKNS